MRRFRLLLIVLGGLAAAFCVFVFSVLLRFGSPSSIPEVALRASVSLLLISVGLWVGAVRPELATTRNAALGLYVTGILWLRNCIHDLIPGLRGADALLFYFFDVGYPLHLVFGLRFFTEFPPGAPPSRALRVLRVANDLAGVGLLVIAKIVELRPFVGLGSLGPLDVIYDHRSFYTGSALLAILVAGVRNYRAAGEGDARLRVRWIVFGTVIALGPEMVAKFAKALGHELPMELFTVVAVAALPLTFAYAVVQHHVLDIQVAVRRGLHYVLARSVLRVLVAAPAVFLVVDIALDPERTLKQLFLASWPRLTLMAVAALGLRFHGPLARALDRLFLGEQVAAEDVLERMLTRLRSEDDVRGVVSRELEAAFHPSSFELHLSTVVPDDLRAALERAEGPVERERSLAVPVRTSDDALSGVIVLGEKASGQPYGPADRRLLRAIGAQLGYALEARSLRERVAVEQRTAREAIARLNPMMECPRCGLCNDAGAQTCPDDGARLELGLPVSQTIDGKYRLERRIGRGGMGAVYRAEDLDLGRRVAVKILVGARVRDGQALRRFEREGRAMARLAHPGIVGVYDFGRIGDEGAYLAMELLEGRTLRDELDRQDGPVEPPTVARWFGPIMEAVAAAHRAGVVHRDLKPENVFITAAGTIKVLDFGLARLSETKDTSTVTRSGILVGTLGYIAPEQFLGKEADAQSDVFSLGVMIFEALTGELPYLGENLAHQATSLFIDDPHLESGGPDVQALDGVLSRCLSPDRKKRPATVRELKEAVLPALAGCRSNVRRRA